MSSLSRLIINELMKIFLRLRTWILISLLLVTELFFSILVRNSLEGNRWVFVSSSAELLAIAQIFIVIIAGDIVASEFSWGTIKLLLIRPANRTKILLSKYGAVLLFAFLIILLLFTTSLVLGSLFFHNDSNYPVSLPKVLAGYAFKSIGILMSLTFAFMLSTVFRSSSLAIGMSIFLMLTGKSIVEILPHLGWNWGKYILFANTDLSQYLYGNQPLYKGTSLQFSILMLIVYYVLFMFLTWISFVKRDVSV